MFTLILVPHHQKECNKIILIHFLILVTVFLDVPIKLPRNVLMRFVKINLTPHHIIPRLLHLFDPMEELHLKPIFDGDAP